MSSLSVFLLARNEEKNLARALSSVMGLGDEIVVVDTGSTDDTVAIARQFGARVETFPWIDDFSAALNFAVSRLNTEWAFRLDADEELLPCGADVLEAATNALTSLGHYVARQDLVEEGNFERFTEMWQLRLFRPALSPAFRGRCHADFWPPLEQRAAELGLVVGYSDVRLRHYGYIGGLKQEKLKRAARLLSLELQDRPDGLYYQIELGRTLVGLGDAGGFEWLERAATTVWEERDGAKASTAMVAGLFDYLLGLPPDKLPQPWSFIELEAVAERWFPHAPPLVWRRARSAFMQGRFGEARMLLERLEMMRTTGRYDRWSSFDPEVLSETNLLQLGICYVRLADLGRAKKAFRQLLDHPVLGEAAKTNLEVVRSLGA